MIGHTPVKPKNSAIMGSPSTYKCAASAAKQVQPQQAALAADWLALPDRRRRGAACGSGDPGRPLRDLLVALQIDRFPVKSRARDPAGSTDTIHAHAASMNSRYVPLLNRSAAIIARSRQRCISRAGASHSRSSSRDRDRLRCHVALGARPSAKLVDVAARVLRLLTQRTACAPVGLRRLRPKIATWGRW